MPTILPLLNPELQTLDCKYDISEGSVESWKIFVPSLGKCGTDLGIFIFHN